MKVIPLSDVQDVTIYVNIDHIVWYMQAGDVTNIGLTNCAIQVKETPSDIESILRPLTNQ